MGPRRGILGGTMKIIGTAALLGLAASAHASGYTIRSGDTLSGIAERYGVSVDALASANGISDPDRIFAGRRLTIPGRDPGSSARSGEFAAPSPGSHRVRSGETLSAIAARHRVAVWALVAANGIGDPDRIIAGSVLAVPRWVCPVPRPVQFSNDWGLARDRGRRHEGNDVFAARGTPVVAPVAGSVEHVEGPRGGKQFKLRGADGHVYYGTHMDRFGYSGPVVAGAIVGYVGATGNAAGTSPHLHFEVHPKGIGPVNPYRALAATCTR